MDCHLRPHCLSNSTHVRLVFLRFPLAVFYGFLILMCWLIHVLQNECMRFKPLHTIVMLTHFHDLVPPIPSTCEHGDEDEKEGGPSQVLLIFISIFPYISTRQHIFKMNV